MSKLPIYKLKFSNIYCVNLLNVKTCVRIMYFFAANRRVDIVVTRRAMVQICESYARSFARVYIHILLIEHCSDR